MSPGGLGRGATSVCPASFAQQRLWFLDQLQPDSAAYNLPLAVRLEGPLDVATLERAFAEVVARHDSLRTTFASDAGVPMQVVSPPAPAPLPLDDLSSLDAAARDAALARQLAATVTAPFDLRAGPLVRARLVRLAPAAHVLVVVASHVIADGISLTLLCKELSALYAAFSAGQPSPLEPPASQFSEYVAWQREHVRGDELERQLGYWRENLQGELPSTELPGDRARPATSTGRAGRLAVPLATPEGAAALTALSRQEKTSPFSAVLAAFSLLLQRYTGHDDVIVGSPFGNRGRGGEGARFSPWLLSIGFYAETVVLRTSLAGDPTFRALLGRAREVVAGAAAHVDVPFEKIVEALRPAREAGRSPFFQIMLSYLAAPDTALVLPGLTVTRLDVPAGGAMFDLLVQVEDARDGLVGYFTYDADLYDQATIARLGANLAHVLAVAVGAPDEPLSSYSVLTGDERRRVLTEWNDTATLAPPDCVHAEIERQAARTPARIAVHSGDVALTYAELDRRANQLARHLRALGVKPDGLVGIALPRGPAMVVAVLATLKAGGAYVPLDPAYPEARLAQMIEDSGLSVVVTLRSIETALALDGAGALPLTGTSVVCLDAEVETLARLEDTRLEGEGAQPEHLAYVIYTSGSTGRPKGVMLEHRLVTNFFAGMDRVLNPTSTAREVPGVWLAMTSLSFDISVLELLWTLARGFTVVVPVDDDKAAVFAAAVEAHGVTHFQCTPSLASLLVAEPAARAALGRLEAMLVGGEALPVDLARELLAALGGDLFNMYGPTETTVWSTASKVDRDALARGEPISIGRPIANTMVYVLDARRQPVPIGVAGELYIGGAGVARGYLRRPELTEERFVPSPFGPGRLYRTGDLCRYRANGRLEFLGRLDHQVKIRGHRIELPEIELAVRDVAGVRDVVVVARPGESGLPNDLRLVVYMAGAAPTPADLRRLLRERLPEPMVPSVFVVLEQLPLTPNGKVDRGALPAPEQLAAQRLASDDVAGFVPPRSPTEQAIGEIWCEVLGVTRVSIYDNFYDLGGHSLLSPQVMHKIEERLKKRLNVAELILQNLAQVAAKCDEAPIVGAPRSRGVLGALKRMIAKGD